MKGEFPRDARVSARVTSSTKRLLKNLKDKGHHESDVIEYAAKQLAKEPTLLEWEIGEYDLQINECESVLSDLKAKRQAKLNRLKMIAPKLIDKETMQNMMKDYAHDYAVSLVNSPAGFSRDRLDHHTARSSVRSAGEEVGYDGEEFLQEVIRQVDLLCGTSVSDI